MSMNALRTALTVSLCAMFAAGGFAQTNTPAPGSEQLSAQLGLNSSHGNSESVSVSAGVDWNENVGRLEQELDFNSYVSKSLGGGGHLSDSQHLDWTIRYGLGSATTRRWFALAHVAGDRNEYAGVGFRAITGPGFGRHIIERTNMRVTLEGGVASAWERKTGGGDTSQFVMPFFHPMMHWDFSKVGYLSQVVEFEFNGEDSGDVRINSDTELSFRITERISLRPSIRVNWDNQPMNGAKALDVITQTSLSYSFYKQAGR